MRNSHALLCRLTAIFTTGSLFLSTAVGMPQTKQATPVVDTVPIDGGWPRLHTMTSGASLVLYQPQIASWEDQKSMTLYAAVAYTPKNGQRALGTVKATTNTKVSVPERLVSYTAFQVTEANFQTLAKAQVQEITSEISSATRDGIIALDRVLAGLDKSQIIPKNVEGVNSEPPEIFFSKTNTILVNFDGPPVWGPIMGTDLQYAINTNWDLFQHVPTKTFYLRYNKNWLRTTTLEGGWISTIPPESFRKLPKDDNWKEVNAAVPGIPLAEKDEPRVILTQKPAEIILIKGEPHYVQVEGTNLFWVSNTESDVFRAGKTGTVFYLVAGRWFSAPDFTGPWTFSSLSLPQEFKRIPVEHERSRVLASVPGTPQAAEAVLLAQVPEIARVNKKTIMAPAVIYQGSPEFVPIDTTMLERAVNTDKDIIKFGDLYYMCFQAVWFVSRSPNGPWEVTGQVPKEIYSIPASSPVHNVTYVTVEDDDDDEVVFAATMAYTGMMVAWGCAVWGSGYYYPPYVWYGGGYPIYYPRYPTYGYSAWYNPWTGAYGRGAGVYGPYGGAGVAARYNPTTGTYARGAAAYGPSGSRAVAHAYNPTTGAQAATRQGSGIYSSWGTTAVTRGDQWAKTSRVTNTRTGTTTRYTETGQGSVLSRRGPDGGGFVGKGSSGDVYAGRDGNVYRNQGGSWQKYENGSWNNVQSPGAQPKQQPQNRPNPRLDSNTANQLDRDRAVRSEGTQRTRELNNSRSSGFSRSGSYRAGGGMRTGGGRRR